MEDYYENGEFSLLDDLVFKEMFGRIIRVKFAEYLLSMYLGVPVNSLKGKVEVMLDEVLEKNH